MPSMNIIQAVNSALSCELTRDQNVVVFGRRRREVRRSLSGPRQAFRKNSGKNAFLTRRSPRTESWERP